MNFSLRAVCAALVCGLATVRCDILDFDSHHIPNTLTCGVSHLAPPSLLLSSNPINNGTPTPRCHWPIPFIPPNHSNYITDNAHNGTIRFHSATGRSFEVHALRLAVGAPYLAWPLLVLARIVVTFRVFDGEGEVAREVRT
ncbi:hypothetical protein EDC01DRAFT_779455 [Geopyxis carbonaria]|nr:hypothetical protein EDC01DRAFT_779455 [Geopyxis carbonaria]